MAVVKGRGSQVGSAVDFFPITPTDGVDLPVNVRALIVSVGGTLSVCKTDGAQTVVALTVPAGRIDIQCSRVNSTGTAATGITGLV